MLLSLSPSDSLCLSERLFLGESLCLSESSVAFILEKYRSAGDGLSVRVPQPSFDAGNFKLLRGLGLREGERQKGQHRDGQNEKNGYPYTRGFYERVRR